MMDPDRQPSLMTVAEFAHHIRVTPEAVRRMIARGELKTAAGHRGHGSRIYILKEGQAILTEDQRALMRWLPPINDKRVLGDLRRVRAFLRARAEARGEVPGVAPAWIWR